MFLATDIFLCCFRNDNQRKRDSLADAYKTANDVRDQAIKEMAEMKARLYRGNTSITLTGSSGPPKHNPKTSGNSLQYPEGGNSTSSHQGHTIDSNSAQDFEFRVPQIPVKRQESFLQKDNHGLRKYNTELQINTIGNRVSDISKGQSDSSNDLPEKLRRSESELKLALGQRSFDDRSSMSSSVSSLGILTPEDLDCKFILNCGWIQRG